MKVMTERYKQIVGEMNKLANELWQESDVELHAEGSTGLPGPSGDSDEPWDLVEAQLEATAYITRIVCARLYPKQERKSEMKQMVLVVVQGGVAYTYTSNPAIRVCVVDCDSNKHSGVIPEVNRDFRPLLDGTGLEEGVDYFVR